MRDYRSSAGFGHLLRDLRQSLRLTQEELAELAGISPRGLRNLESGRVTRPRRATVDALARGLGLAPDAHARLLAAAQLSPMRLASLARERVDESADGMAPAQLQVDAGDFTDWEGELRQFVRRLQVASTLRTAPAITAIVVLKPKRHDRSGDDDLTVRAWVVRGDHRTNRRLAPFRLQIVRSGPGPADQPGRARSGVVLAVLRVLRRRLYPVVFGHGRVLAGARAQNRWLRVRAAKAGLRDLWNRSAPPMTAALGGALSSSRRHRCRRGR